MTSRRQGGRFGGPATALLAGVSILGWLVAGAPSVHAAPKAGSKPVASPSASPVAAPSPSAGPSGSPAKAATPAEKPASDKTPPSTDDKAKAAPKGPFFPPPGSMNVQQRMPADTRSPSERDKDKTKRDKVQWYGSLSGAYSGISLPFSAATRKVAYSGEIPLRLDREFLGTRYVTPVGGSLSDGITGNSFQLDRGGASSANLLVGLAIPTSDASWLSFDANTYFRGGNPLIARSWGALLPYGHFLDVGNYNGFKPPTFEPQFYRGMWFENTKERKMRAVVGDYLPMTWYSASGPRERNFVDLGLLTFRPFVINLSEMGAGSVYSTDRSEPELRAPVRGASFWMQQGPFEVETLYARGETHPSTPFDGFRYREAVGGRAGWQTKWWGAGFSFWHMYGDNYATAGAPTVGVVPGGSETLWSLDTSAQFLKNFYGYGTVARTRFSKDKNIFSSKDEALVLGLMLKSCPGKDGYIRVQYQTLDPNYEPLSVRQRVTYPENYCLVSGEVKYPFTGGSAMVSVRQYGQMQPDVAVRGTHFAVADQFFPSSASNRGRGNILDWLLATDFDLGTRNSPWHLFASWESVHFTRGTTPGLAYSATDRTVTQQMGLLRYAPWKQWAFDVGVARYSSNGYIGTFARNVTFNETQLIPRLGVNYRPNDDSVVKLTWRNYDFRDGNPVAKGINDYSAQQIMLELETKLGGDGIIQPTSSSY